ncbi:hypothetical protein MTO96_025140 [Rhipicephalus appendiculatus]
MQRAVREARESPAVATNRKSCSIEHASRRLGIHVTTKKGTRIPTVSKIRVLGLWFEENGADRELVAQLQKKVAAATHLVRS